VAYVTLAEVQAAQPETLEISQSVVQQAIDAGAAEIDGYIARYYVLPLTVTAPLLKALNVDIALYRLYASRVAFQEAPRPQDITWETRYKTAIAILLKLANGDMVLTDSTGAVVPQSDTGAAWSTTMNYTPTFGEGAEQGFMVDPDKIDDEAGRRG